MLRDEAIQSWPELDRLLPCVKAVLVFLSLQLESCTCNLSLDEVSLHFCVWAVLFRDESGIFRYLHLCRMLALICMQRLFSLLCCKNPAPLTEAVCLAAVAQLQQVVTGQPR